MFHYHIATKPFVPLLVSLSNQLTCFMPSCTHKRAMWTKCPWMKFLCVPYLFVWLLFAKHNFAQKTRKNKNQSKWKWKHKIDKRKVYTNCDRYNHCHRCAFLVWHRNLWGTSPFMNGMTWKSYETKRIQHVWNLWEMHRKQRQLYISFKMCRAELQSSFGISTLMWPQFNLHNICLLVD